MPSKVWTSGELVTAADQNVYLQQQVIATFADAAARDAAIPAPLVGMHAYLTGSEVLTVYTGSSWTPTARAMRFGVHTFQLTDSSEATTTITFGAAFPSTPVVVATARPFSARRYLATITSVSATSFSLWVTEVSGAPGSNTVETQWIAIG